MAISSMAFHLTVTCDIRTVHAVDSSSSSCDSVSKCACSETSKHRHEDAMQFGSRNICMGGGGDECMGCICKVVRINSSDLLQQVVSALHADRRFVQENRQLTLDVTLGAATRRR